MSPERRAVLLLMGLAVAGHGVRAALAPKGMPPGAVTLVGARTAHAALARRDSLAALARPLGSGERIDVDRAGLQELGRLPGVGPGLARRILEDRERNGPYGTPDGLDRVPGVGARLLERLAPHLAFSGQPTSADTGGKAARRASGSRGMSERADAPPGRLLTRAPTPKGILSDEPLQPGRQPDLPRQDGLDILNTGSVAALDRLPGIGPAKARRIVAFRDSAGPFRTPADLARVPGISIALATRLWHVAGAP